MSTQAAVQFVDKLAGNPALRAKVEQAMNGKEGNAAAEAVASIGRKEGFSFTADEAMSVRNIYLKKSSGKELTDDELSTVSGGSGSSAGTAVGNAFQEVGAFFSTGW